MERITAEEARELSQNCDKERIDDAVNNAYALIRVAATKKLRQVALHSHFWVNEGNKESAAWVAAKERLEKDGFTVNYHYNDIDSFTEYTVVKW